MKIINRKIITISQDLNADREWIYNLNLNFQPDQMIVKSITCNGNPAAPITGNCLLYCSTINEVLGSFYNNGCSVYPNTLYDSINYPINNIWVFQVLNVDRSVNATFNGGLIFQLEFVKFE